MRNRFIAPMAALACAAVAPSSAMSDPVEFHAPEPQEKAEWKTRPPGRYATAKAPMSQPKRRLMARRTHPHGF